MRRRNDILPFLVCTFLFVTHSVRASLAGITRNALMLEQAIKFAGEHCAINKRMFRMFGERHLEKYTQLRSSKVPLSSRDLALAKCYGEHMCSKGAGTVRDAEKLWAGAKSYCTDDKLITGTSSNEELEAYDSNSSSDDEDTSLLAPTDEWDSGKTNVTVDLGQSFNFLVAFALGVLVAFGFFYATSRNFNGATVQKTLRRPEL